MVLISACANLECRTFGAKVEGIDYSGLSLGFPVMLRSHLCQGALSRAETNLSPTPSSEDPLLDSLLHPSSDISVRDQQVQLPSNWPSASVSLPPIMLME